MLRNATVELYEIETKSTFTEEAQGLFTFKIYLFIGTYLPPIIVQ